MIKIIDSTSMLRLLRIVLIFLFFGLFWLSSEVVLLMAVVRLNVWSQSGISIVHRTYVSVGSDQSLIVEVECTIIQIEHTLLDYIFPYFRHFLAETVDLTLSIYKLVV